MYVAARVYSGTYYVWYLELLLFFQLSLTIESTLLTSLGIVDPSLILMAKLIVSKKSRLTKIQPRRTLKKKFKTRSSYC